MEKLRYTKGVVWGDHDGDQDIYAQMGGAYPGDGFGNALFRNPGFGRHWIKLRLVGTRSNRQGVGCRIRAVVEESGVRRPVYTRVDAGGSFGGNPLRKELGLGGARRIERLEVYWPASDSTQVFEDVPADRFLEVTEGGTAYRVLPHPVVSFGR